MTLVHTVSHPGGVGPQPTLIAFHGYGADAHDLISLSSFLASGKLLMICPQGEVRIEPSSAAFSWYRFVPPDEPAPEEIERATSAAWDFIDLAVERYDADPQRLAILGFSQGGSMAYRLGFERPERFVGVSAIATSLPSEIGSLPHLNSAQQALPVFVQHGSDDPTVRIERGREARERLDALGNGPEYQEYDRMGHGINGTAAQHLSEWLAKILAVH